MKRASVVLALLVSLGCSDSPRALPQGPDVVVPAPSPAAAVAVVPSPSPAPEVTGPSDVDSLAMLNFAKCEAGQPFVVTTFCREIVVTATPKRSDGSDAKKHGRRLTWIVEGVVIPDDAQRMDVWCVYVSAGPYEDTFNRTFHRKGPGGCQAAVEAVLVDPQGVTHRVLKTVTVH